MVVVSGYNAELRAKVIDRWQELEAKAAKPNLPDFTNPAIAARAWAEQYEARELESAKRLIAEKALEEAQPAIGFHDEVAFRPDVEFLLRTAAKTLMGGKGAERKLVEWLINQKWLTKTGGPREATSYAITRGLMRQRIDVVNGYPYQVAVLTGKGMAILRAAIHDGELFTAGQPRAMLMPPGMA